MTHPADRFTLSGTEVALDDLLALRYLAQDPERMPPRRAQGQRLGEQRSAFRGQGREFAELRRYQPGDDVRRIDWHVTARKQYPYVQVMEEDRQTPQLIWLDLSESLYFGSRRLFKSVLACHWAAFVAWRMIERKHPTVGLITGAGNPLPMTLRRPADVAQFCQQLVTAHHRLAQTYRQRVAKPEPARLWPHLRQRPTVWLVSDLDHWQPAELDRILPPGRIQHLVVLQPVDALESDLPDAGTLDIQSGDRLARLNTASPRVRAAHHRRFEARQQTWHDWMARRGGRFLPSLSQTFDWSEVRRWPLHL